MLVSILGGIVALLQAIPALEQIFIQLVALWASAVAAKKRYDVLEGVRDILQKQDQRRLEDAIGSPNAGQPALDRDGVRERRGSDAP